MSDNVAMPSFCVKAPEPIGELTAGKTRIFIYENERQSWGCGGLNRSDQWCYRKGKRWSGW